MDRRRAGRTAAAGSVTIALALALLIAGCAPVGKATGAPSPTDPTGHVPPMSSVTLSAPWAAASEETSPSASELPRECGAITVPGGKNHSPALSWTGSPPAGTASYALAMVDMTPPGRGVVHWLVLDIPVATSSIATAASGTEKMPRRSAELRSETGGYGYAGPAPPAGTHTYLFVLYAMPSATSGLGRSAAIDRFFETVSRALGARTLAATYTK